MIERALDPQSTPIHDMGINHGRLNVFMTHHAAVIQRRKGEIRRDDHVRLNEQVFYSLHLLKYFHIF